MRLAFDLSGCDFSMWGPKEGVSLQLESLQSMSANHWTQVCPKTVLLCVYVLQRDQEVDPPPCCRVLEGRT